MRRLALLIATLAAAIAAPAAAQDRYVVRTTWTQEWVEAPADAEPGQRGDRLIAVRRANIPTALAAFGPFRVLDATHAALVGETDSASPAQFAAMLRAFPGIATLEMIECPGTSNDRANLHLGQMIRADGIATHVPPDGSVRSGAVELFLAGVRRTADEGAQFAVHAWRDPSGLQATDYAIDAPQNRAYLQYYRAMGMDAGTARAFYDMTNSVPNSDALWLTARDMRPWLGRMEEGVRRADSSPASGQATAPAPRIAYLDLGADGL